MENVLLMLKYETTYDKAKRMHEIMHEKMEKAFGNEFCKKVEKSVVELNGKSVLEIILDALTSGSSLYGILGRADWSVLDEDIGEINSLDDEISEALVNEPLLNITVFKKDGKKGDIVR